MKKPSQADEEESVEIQCPAAFFSPQIREVLVKLITDEKQSIEGACYEFTLFDLTDLWVQNAVQKKLKSQLIVDDVLDSFKKYKTNYIKLPHALTWLKLHEIEVFASEIRNKDPKKFGGYGNMHHKFFLFGKNGITNRRLLITGSFNWTGQADINNYEDIVILDNEKIIAQYEDYYKKMPRKELSMELLHLYRLREIADKKDKLVRSKKINFLLGTDEKKLDILLLEKHPTILQKARALEKEF